MIEKLTVHYPFPDNPADENVDFALKINEIIEHLNRLETQKETEAKTSQVSS